MIALGRVRNGAIALAAALVGLAVVSALASQTPVLAAIDREAAFASSQAAVGRKLDDFVFTTADGVTRRLSEYQGKPLVLSLVFTGCTQSCPLTTERLADAAEEASKIFGPSRYRIVTLGFDSRNDTPARMRAFATSHGIRAANWEFVSADPGTVYALAEQLGFLYLAQAGGFDHLAQTTILRADGTVYQHIYGAEFEPPALVEPLKALFLDERAIASPIGGLIERIRLLCTNYNAATGHYGFNFGIFFGLVIGALSLIALLVVLIRAIRRAYRVAPPPRRSA